MNLKHLGDAFDHWKGSVIELIGGKTLRVLPMFTDQKKWKPRQLSTYARLLHRKPGDILKQKVTFSRKSRAGYFGNLGNEDLFLDPDTGILPDQNATKRHVKPSEIATLLEESGSRMLLIYQHSSHEKDGFSEKLKLLRRSDGLDSCFMFAYDAGTVSMVILSRSKNRVKKASKRIRSWLGPVGPARIIQ